MRVASLAILILSLGLLLAAVACGQRGIDTASQGEIPMLVDADWLEGGCSSPTTQRLLRLSISMFKIPSRMTNRANKPAARRRLRMRYDFFQSAFAETKRDRSQWSAG